MPVELPRRRKVAVVAHCLLNQNAKVDEFARTAGAVPGVGDALRRHGYRMHQLPCPEMAFAGVGRWWQGKELYDKPNDRRHCRALAERSVDILEPYLRHGDVVLVGLDGSPSSGVWIDWLRADVARRGEPALREIDLSDVDQLA